MREKNIELFVKEISQVIQQEKEKEKMKPGKMSLLSMFRYSYENAHSDVLRYLLDPKEEHRHGTEYLELFLKEVGFVDLCQYDLTLCKIYRESTHIDLYIEHEYFSIIIENKIWAEDQPQQLERYYNTVTKEWSVNKDKVYIIYLTLTGYEASDKSQGELKNTIFKEMREKKTYLDVSYSYHILRWLRQLSFKSSEHTLQSAVEQYIYNLEILTHQTERDTNMNQEIMSKIKEFNSSIEESVYLSKAFFTHACMKDLIEIFNTLKSGSINHNLIYINKLKEVGIDELEKYLFTTTSRRNRMEIGVCIKIANDLGITFVKCGSDVSAPDKYWIGYASFDKTHGEYDKLENYENDFKNTNINPNVWSKEVGWYFGETLYEKPSNELVIEKLLKLYDVVKDIK